LLPKTLPKVWVEETTLPSLSATTKCVVCPTLAWALAEAEAEAEASVVGT
jgi:hypothetical protein